MISLLIITYNRAGDLLALLESLSKQDLSSLEEVLILNNASTESYDEAERFIASNLQLKINYQRSEINLGVSRGRNKLMQEAQGDWLLVLDDDVELSGATDLLTIAQLPSLPFFQENNTAVITLRVIYYETREVQKTALPHKKFEEYKDKAKFLTSYFTGCAHFLKREVLAATGYYPEDFFYGMEEYDLSYRIIRAGYSLGYDNSVTILHKESPKGRQPNHEKLSSQWLNKSKVAYRYLPFIYYVSTSMAWSIEYIKKAKGNWGTFFKTWSKVAKIPFAEKRSPVGKEAMKYLKRVKSRLWF